VSQSKTPEFSCEMAVRWGDLDAFGHVNNTVYFRYFEEARFQWLLARDIATEGESYPVVVTIGCTFLRPLFHPETIRIDMYLSEPGRSSFMVTYKLYTHAQPEVPAAEGYSKVVWVSRKNGRSIPLPAEVRAWFEAQVAE